MTISHTQLTSTLHHHLHHLVIGLLSLLRASHLVRMHHSGMYAYMSIRADESYMMLAFPITGLRQGSRCSFGLSLRWSFTVSFPSRPRGDVAMLYHRQNAPPLRAPLRARISNVSVCSTCKFVSETCILSIVPISISSSESEKSVVSPH